MNALYDVGYHDAHGIANHPRHVCATCISDLLPVRGDGHQGLFDYQWDAVARLVDNPVHLLADQPGLGKTWEILAALAELGLLSKPGARILISAPKLVAQLGWTPALEMVSDAFPHLTVLNLFEGTSAKKEARAREAMLIVDTVHGTIEPTDKIVLALANHNAIDYKPGRPIKVPTLLATRWDAIIIDEAHLVLPTQQDARMPELTQFWHGLESLVWFPEQIRWPVSGTPERGKLENRLGYWRFMWPTDPQYARFWPWVNRNFRTYKQHVTKHIVKTAIEQKPLDLMAWLLHDRAHITRRTKLEVLAQLPAKLYDDVRLELTPKMRADYKAYEDALMTEYSALIDKGFTEAAVHLREKMYIRGRQMAICAWQYLRNGDGEHAMPLPAAEGESPKLEWIIEFLRERVGTGAKVIISSDFTQVLEWLLLHLQARVPEMRFATLHGGTGDVARRAIMDQFQHGDLQVVLLSQRLGQGITLDAADDLIFVDVPNDPDKAEQVEDRVHRAGTIHQVTIHRLIMRGTKDVAVASRQDATHKKLRTLSDKSRGVDEARQTKGA